MRFLVVGAGLSGATLARQLAEYGALVTVIDELNHVAGHCHSQRDATTGVMVHRYGPHIFHTDSEHVWQFVERFAEMKTYRHRVMATYKKEIYGLPINLHTINQFYRRAMSPLEARNFIATRTVKLDHPAASFEDQALASVGPELYEAFLRGYTIKQWGVSPRQLPASVLKRLPLRFNYDTNYFHHERQAIPNNGYTDLVERMLAHEKIDLRLGVPFERFQESLTEPWPHTFYTGPIDRFFGYSDGHLSYRTLDFEYLRDGVDQGVAVMNFTDAHVPWTRVTDYRRLSPWEQGCDADCNTVLVKEYARDARPNDTPFYPVRNGSDIKTLTAYVSRAATISGITFLGRLGCYAYIDMDVAIARALEVADVAIDHARRHQTIPVFVHAPA